MRICHIVNGDLWAGAEAQAFSLIVSISQLPGISIRTIVFNEGILTTKLRHQRIKVDIVREDQNNVFLMVRAIYKILKADRIQCLHVHGFKENFIGGIAARFAGVRAIIRTHHGKGMVGTRGQNGYIERINRAFLSDKMIAVSKDLRDFLVRNGFDEKKILVVRNGIDADVVEPRNGIEVLKKHFGIPTNKVVIGTIGRLEPIKGPHHFLEAAKNIALTRTNVFFVMAGDGSLFDVIRTKVEKFGIDSITCLPGFTEAPIDWLRAIDIFVLPSMHEGIPMVLLEAMVLGKPIVATSVGGIPEVIRDRYSGLLTSPKDPLALASKILELIDNEELRTHVSHNARKAVLERFSLEKTVMRTVEGYREFEQ